jgi:hypothetical protein
MKSNNRLRRGLAVATVVSALGAPAASAAPIEQLVPNTASDEQSGQSVPVRVIEVSVDGGFNWADAGIGATGGVALLAIAGGALIAMRRRPHPGRSAA